MTAVSAPLTCPECGDDLSPGDRVVRVERGEMTPYGLAPSDADYGASRHFHRDCLAVESDGGGPGGGEG